MADPKSITENVAFVYVLRHPTTKAVCYVGRSRDPNQRLRKHVRNSRHDNNPVSRWLRELPAPPVLEIIETCADSCVGQRERYWIGEYAKTEALLNSLPAGPRQLTKADVTRTRSLVLGGVCKHGHTLSADNVRIRPDRNNCIECRQCLQEGRRRFNERNPLYDIWVTMVRRCTDPNFTDWDLYGGREPSITVCDRWRQSCETFAADVGPRPSLIHTLDRINSKQGYSPDNCRWAKPKEQMRNMRRNRSLTYEGQTFTIAEWAERLGLKYLTVFMRIKRGWSVAEALTTPLVNVRDPRRFATRNRNVKGQWGA